LVSGNSIQGRNITRYPPFNSGLLVHPRGGNDLANNILMEIKLFEDVLQAPWPFATVTPTQATETHSSGVATDQDSSFFAILACVDVSPNLKDPAQLMDMTIKTTLAPPCHAVSAFTKTVHRISLYKSG
jgi:hypothetical protein